jgi:hypothetical protein
VFFGALNRYFDRQNCRCKNGRVLSALGEAIADAVTGRGETSEGTPSYAIDA